MVCPPGTEVSTSMSKRHEPLVLPGGSNIFLYDVMRQDVSAMAHFRSYYPYCLASERRQNNKRSPRPGFSRFAIKLKYLCDLGQPSGTNRDARIPIEP